MKNNFLLLFVIVLIAGFLRIYKIDVNPPSLSWDEVSIGYNAYSILKTGKDEHGKFLPIDTFVGYGDYKPPLSIYATVPFVAALGLNELSVRLPSAIAGTVTVLLTYFLVFELFQISYLSLVSCLLLAISPWHIQLSRAGFEANIALMLVVLGAYLFLAARKKPVLWTVCLLPFVATIYTFNSARYFMPFLVTGLAVYVRKSISPQIFKGAFIAIVLLLPIIPHLFSKEARLRFTEVNIFTDINVVTTANKRMSQDENSFASRVFDNRRVGYVRSYLSHYFDHFDPQFLFVRGDGNPKFSLQDVGQLYVIEFPLLLTGMYWIFKKNRKTGFFLLYWLLTSIIPAAVARETPHALRIENSLPTWQIFIAAGVLWFFDVLQNKFVKRMFSAFLIVSYTISLLYFLHTYYVHYPKEYSREWQYGYREAIGEISQRQDQYEHIYVTELIGRPYMYMLFYLKYDPAKYLSMKNSYFDAAGFYHVDAFDKYIFVGNNAPKYEKNSLYVMPSDQRPEGSTLISTIHTLDGKAILDIFDL